MFILKSIKYGLHILPSMPIFGLCFTIYSLNKARVYFMSTYIMKGMYTNQLTNIY